MKSGIHHAAIAVREFDWYVTFFEKVFDMTVERTTGETPNRQLWVAQGIPVNECSEPRPESDQPACDHISIGVDIDPVEAAEKAVENGCRHVEGKGAHWFALPNGVLLEMKPLR